ncbi:glycine betaine L-proline transport ATP-binding protein proV [Lacticaseibacillus pantheris DSM 15945 = JCM 12539 = NBRC 106106]|uniref:Quaternary amine transport ATP-binding protein n=1 Tax=Lacticaseibacillus pantheris DSM 15945 = JCM 12539 = NBRC 106106 TaxID=1423783 RepID=A0A0R1U0D3_9LACO|nr:glycine betaine/L-proline ABC transporter ATP-binding protein [Lacticaseibacillus pantheris]KRL86921.1 glycine betaine L-proline transport ATP-binding protein proV [Lacticaseibacillus pantheris DSM 15945 = JCM 12539 = NBRC 106106]
MEKVKVEHLTKIFGGHNKQVRSMIEAGKSKAEILKATGSTVGVSDISFNVQSGEIFVIMGLSGSGKSTLIRMINRLIEPTSGRITIDGEDLTQLDKKQLREVRRHKMSMVFQQFALFPQRTILDNAAYGLEIQGVGKDERYAKANKALDRVGLNGYADQYPDQLSGGMQQRVGLARALANDADILLMDEAFSALDPLNRKDMQDELLELQADLHKTIIFISHDLNEALRIGNRIMIMRDGQLVQIGTPEEILTAPANDYVERFIEDVDRTKVITVGSVMIRPYTVNIETDGPRLALRRMRANEVSTLFVTNNQRELVGFIEARDTIKLIADDKDRSVRSIRTIVNPDVQTTTAETPLNDIIDEISSISAPLGVLDDKKRLIGVVIRGAVLAAIAGD